MKMKKIVAPTMPEALKIVRKELGSDAVILNSKVVYSGGFLGMFRKKQFEVVAGVDRPVKRPPEEPKNEVSATITAELDQLRGMVETLSKMQQTHYPAAVDAELAWWRTKEFDEQWLAKLGDALTKEWKNAPDDADLHTFAKKWLKIQVESLTHSGIESDKKYINVVGPTGVGKTTTIAKMAARLVVEEGKKVAFISADTYRIAAIEQLKTYAELLQVPLEVVYTREDFDRAAGKFGSYDHVFIDTAGRNYLEQRYVQDLKQLIDLTEVQTFLVLAVTSKPTDMHSIVEQFQEIGIDRFILTKWDESNSSGGALSVMLKSRIGAAYLTTGQAVPEDLMEATPQSVVTLLTEGVNG